MQTKIKVTGMHCASCKTLIEDVAKDVAGVQSCTVDPATGEGVVEHNETFDFANFAKDIATLDKYTIQKI